MSTVLPAEASPTGRDPSRRAPAPGGRDAWRSPLFNHLVLATILAATLPLAGTGGVWSADEGALLYQATAVIEGRGWTFDHPFPAADPSGGWFPLHLSSFAADGGYLVLGKHTPFVWLAGALYRLGGYPAVLALSTISALAAASAASRLAARLDPGAALPTLWLTGLASPLFLSAYVAWAHTLAAALVGWALVGLTADVRGRSWPAEASGAIALGLACLMRTEATLAAVALTLALALPRSPIRSWWSAAGPTGLGGVASAVPSVRYPASFVPPRAAVLAGMATVAGYGLDRASAIGRLGPVRPPGDRWGGLVGRIEGFAHTWLRPDFSSQPEHLLFLGSATAMIAAGVLARRRGLDAPIVLAALAAAAGAVLIRFALSPTALIPGLVVAFPILFVGLVLANGDDFSRGSAMVLTRFVALFWFAVLATQYRYGGGGEWGGRYFAIGLPAAIPVATVALVRAVGALEPPGRRRVLGLVGIVVVLPVAMGVLGLRTARDRTEAITDRVDASLVEAGDGGPPIVVTTLAPLGRWAWEDVDRGRWLLVDDEDLPEVGERLRGLGVERMVFVTDEIDAELPGLADWFRPIEPLPDGPGASLDRVVVPLLAASG